MKRIYLFFILIVAFQFVLFPSIIAQCNLNVTITADPPAPFCTGETVTLSPNITGGTAAYTYAWETGETTPTIQAVIGVDEHVTLVVTDDNGCTDEYIIKLSAWLDVINIEWPPTVCEGEELEVSVYISPITLGAVIEWSNGQTGLYNYITNSGTYSVTVTDIDNGCSLSDTAFIDINYVPAPDPQIMGPSVLCQGQSAALSINADPNDFIIWSTGSQQTTTTINGPGTYTVLVNNSNFCTGYDTLVVTSGGALPLLDGPTNLCAGQSGLVEVTNASEFTDFDWNTGETTPSITVNGPGTFLVTLTDGGGCTATGSLLVSSTPTNITVPGVITQPSGGQNNGAINASVSPTGTYTYNWSNGATTEDLTGLGEGTYTVTVTDGGGCTATASFVLAAPGCTMSASISVSVPTPGVVCVGDNITITANVTGGTAPFTYNWSNGITTQSFTVPAPYNQTLVLGVTDDDGCTALATIHIKVNVWYVDINYSQIPTCQGETLTLIASTTAEIPGTTYTWSTGETGFMINVTNSGTYSVSMTHPSVPCTAEATVTVTIGTAPAPNPQIAGPITLCPGQSGTLTVNGGPFSTYTWSDGSTDPTLAITDPGGYFVTVTNAEGCTGEDFIEVQAGGAAPFLNDPNPICPGQSTTLEVINPAEFTDFLWSNGGTGPSITVNTPGTYTVTVTAAGGCTATASATVSSNPTNITVSGVITQPSGGQNNGAIDASISPTGTYTYIWSNGANTEDLTDLSEGTYTVTVTDGGGCTATASFTLTAPSCNGFAGGIVDPGGTYCLGTFTLGSIVNGGTMPYTYNWSTGGTGPTETVVLTGALDVSLTVTDDMGCTFTHNLHMKPFFWQQIVEVGPPSSEGQPVQLSVYPDLPFYDYLWSTGETSVSISVTTPATYTVTISDDVSGCTKVIDAVPMFLPGLTVSIDGPATLCPGQTATLSTLGGPFSSYAWSPNGETTPTISISGPGTFGVTVSNGSGCDGNTQLQVSPEPVAAPQIDAPAAICQGSSAVLNILNSGEYVSFLWSNGETNPSITVSSPGTYVVTVTNAGGCTATGSTTIATGSSNFNITGTTSPTSSCTIFNGSIDVSVSPSGVYGYSWSNGLTTEDLTNLAAGSYTVTVTEPNGCTASEVFTVVEIVVSPSPSTAVTPATCGQENGAVDLTISPAGTYDFLWSNGATDEDLANLAAGNYEVTVTSSTTGCTAVTSATVQDNGFIPSITGTASPNTSCTASNGSINTNVSPSGSYDFIWSNSGDTPNIGNLAAGTYTVTVTAGGNCTNSASFIVEENAALPSLTATIIPAVCGDPIGAIDLSVAPAGNYVFSWSNGASSEDLTGLAPGNYTVIATVTVTGCTASSTFNVPNNSSSFTLTGSASPVTNCGAPNGLVNLNVSPSGTYSFLWSNGEMTEDLQNLIAGNYAVIVTQAGACTGEASFQVTSQVVLPLLAQNSSPASCGQPNGSVDLSVTPASGNFFSWSNGSSSEDLQNVPSGSYAVTVTSANGCTATTSATVLENSPNITLTGVTTANTSCTGANGAVDLTASPSGVYNYNWSNGMNSEDLQNLAGGNYTVTVSAGGNCTSTASFTVPNNSGAPDLTAANTPAVCGQSNGSINLTASPTSVYVFAWSNGTATEDLQNLPAGNYAVTCTGANGCTSSTTVSVPNNNTNFTLSTAATPSSSCTAAYGLVALSISPSGTYDFIWSNGEVTEDLQNIAAGNYSVTVTDASGCSDIASATVGGPTAAQVVVVGPNAACVGASVSFSASAGFLDYLWSNGMTGQGITVSQPATYVVTATDANGCTATASQLFSNFPQPTPAINGPASICGSSTQFTVSGGVFSQINWSTGETGPGITVSQSGNYTVTVTNANGCTATDSQSLSIGTSLQPSIATASSCNGTAALDAGQGYATYLWSNGGNAQILSVTASGTYAVTVSNGTGCTGETSAQISIPTPPQVAIMGANSICQGGSTQFSVPNNFTQINWSTGAVTPSVTVSQPATYSVTVSDSNGCTASASQTLTVGAGLTPDITATLTDCNGSTSLDAGLGYASYLWSNGSSLQNITVSANGTFTVTVTDASGCSGIASETVTIPTPPQVQVVGASQICEGDATMLAAPGNFTQYLWSTGEVTPQITVTQGGNYAVTVSDSNGCTASDSWVVAQLLADFTLLETTACSPLDTGTVTTLLTNQFGCDSVVVVATVLAQPIFTQIELEVCQGESAVFNGVAIPAGSSQDFVFTGANGCDSTVSVNVVAFPAISFELKSVPACQDLPNGSIAILMLGGEQPYHFSLNGGAYQSDTLFADLPPGSYMVVAQDGNGCVFPEAVNIPAIPPMVVEVEDETMVCGETVLLKPLVVSSLDVVWAWSDSSGVVSTVERLLVDSPGTYFFTVKNACEIVSGELSVEVEPLKQAKLIYLPNSFSPNDDGLNDCYQGYVDPKLELLSYDLKIFDRWGDQLFETTDIEGCWDGWFRGKEMDPAVMVYWMRMLVRNCDGEVVEVFRKGDVHLVR